MHNSDCQKIMEYIHLNPNSKSKKISEAINICTLEINQFLHREKYQFPWLAQTTDYGWIISYE